MRTVRLEHRARESLDRHVEEFSRFEEVYHGLEWLLANDPKQGVALSASINVCFRTAQWADTPGILAAFSHSDNEVVIHDLKAVPRQDD